MRTHAGQEHGFTIVEVLVAAFILTMVIGGMIYFVASSGRAQSKSGVRQQLVAYNDKIVQSVRAERRWLDTCNERNLGCDVPGKAVDITSLVAVPAGKDTKRFEHDVRIVGIDSEADGVGTNDSDGLQLDLFRIHAKVKLTAKEAREHPGVEPYETVSTVDASAIGRAMGTLGIEVCEVVNQFDERLPVAGCRKDGANREVTPLKPQPDGCPSDANTPLTKSDVKEAPIMPFGCNAALNDARSSNAYHAGMHVRSATDVAFRIKSVDTGKVYIKNDAVLKGASTYVFAGIPAGAYTLEVTNPGPGREIWASRMVPSKNRISVQANQDARGLIVVRPKQYTGQYVARFGRTTYHYTLRTEVTTQSFSKSVTLPGSAGGTATITSNYTYEWLVPDKNKPRREEWWGPAWTGYVGMGVKPFDRARNPDGTIAQYLAGIPWNGRNAKYTLPVGTNLTTGLQSRPIQVPVGPYFTSKAAWMFGDFGKQFVCPPEGPNGPAGGGCVAARDGSAHVWIRHAPGEIGKPTTSTFFHSADGECWVTANGDVPNSVWPFNKPVLVSGGTEGKRCNRRLNLGKATRVNEKGEEFAVNGGKDVTINDFYPHHLTGAGGKRYLISMKLDFACGGCTPGSSGGGSYGSGTSQDGNEFSLHSYPTPKLDYPPPPINIADPDGGDPVVVNPD